MDQAGDRRAIERTRRRGPTKPSPPAPRRGAVGVAAMGLGMLSVLVGCGGGDSGSEARERASRPAAGSGPEEAATSTTAPSTTTTTGPPRVVYEVDGAGSVLVDYSIAGDRSQSREITLPWSEEQAEEPSRLSMLVALAGSQGDVTCRIRRGDEVLAEATLSGTAGPLLACDHPPSGIPQVTFPPPPPPPPPL